MSFEAYSCVQWIQGVGAATKVVQADMQMPWWALQVAGHPVSNAHQPTGPLANVETCCEHQQSTRTNAVEICRQMLRHLHHSKTRSRHYKHCSTQPPTKVQQTRSEQRSRTKRCKTRSFCWQFNQEILMIDKSNLIQLVFFANFSTFFDFGHTLDTFWTHFGLALEIWNNEFFGWKSKCNNNNECTWCLFFLMMTMLWLRFSRNRTLNTMLFLCIPIRRRFHRTTRLQLVRPNSTI